MLLGDVRVWGSWLFTFPGFGSRSEHQAFSLSPEYWAWGRRVVAADPCKKKALMTRLGCGSIVYSPVAKRRQRERIRPVIKPQYQVSRMDLNLTS